MKLQRLDLQNEVAVPGLGHPRDRWEAGEQRDRPGVELELDFAPDEDIVRFFLKPAAIRCVAWAGWRRCVVLVM